MVTMQHRFTYFSKHALERIHQRTQLSADNIADIIDFGMAIDSGTELVFNRKHWLIYSEIDKCFFIVIQDSHTGLVVTILPITYHENLAWRVNEVCFTQAKCNIESNDISKLRQKFSKRIFHEKPVNIQVKVRYFDNNNTPKTKNMFKLHAADYNYSTDNIPIDNGFKHCIREQCVLAGVDPLNVFEVLLSYHKKNPPRIIAWQYS